MQTQSQQSPERKYFTSTGAFAAELVDKLEAGSTEGLDLSQMETYAVDQGREITRLILQEGLNKASSHDRHLNVVGADDIERSHQKRSPRHINTVVGPVVLQRETYAARKTPMLAPADAALNLPSESYSFGVRRHIAEQAAQVSFDSSVKNVRTLGGIEIPKRQAEEQTAAAATDFDAFYEQRNHVPDTSSGAKDDYLVVSMDGKGIVMRPDSLRESTQKKAAAQAHKLSKRLSKGEKKDRKRMAQVAAVYSIKRHVRTADDIIKPLGHVRDADAKSAPKATKKRVWASIKKPMEGVNSDVFDEALLRDPNREKTWVALVDGNKNQLGDILALADHHNVQVTPIIDIIHVLQYIWLAAWCFYKEGDNKVQKWVTGQLRGVLEGKSSQVAAAIRRTATNRKLEPNKRKGADKCANYLLSYKEFLRYDQYLAAGMPIATGVIEGTCRYLVKDRMDITGARWSTDGAEAILQMRALLINGDMDEYWEFHKKREYLRNHAVRYSGNVPPEVPTKPPETTRQRHLRSVESPST